MSIRTAMIKENLDQKEGQPEPNSVRKTGGGAVLDATPCSALDLLEEWIDTVQSVDAGVYQDMIDKTEEFIKQNA